MNIREDSVEERLMYVGRKYKLVEYEDPMSEMINVNKYKVVDGNYYANRFYGLSEEQTLSIIIRELKDRYSLEHWFTRNFGYNKLVHPMIIFNKLWETDHKEVYGDVCKYVLDLIKYRSTFCEDLKTISSNVVGFNSKLITNNCSKVKDVELNEEGLYVFSGNNNKIYVNNDFITVVLLGKDNKIYYKKDKCWYVGTFLNNKTFYKDKEIIAKDIEYQKRFDNAGYERKIGMPRSMSGFVTMKRKSHHSLCSLMDTIDTAIPYSLRHVTSLRSGTKSFIHDLSVKTKEKNNV